MASPGLDADNALWRRPADRPLLWIIGLAIVLRLLAALYLGNEVRPTPGAFDQVSYDALAQRVVAGMGFTMDGAWWPATRAGEPTAHWSFLYTGLLAATYAVFGYAPLIARLLQAVLIAVLLSTGIFLLARETLGRRPALWAAGAAAVYTYFVYYSATLMTEMPAITAVVWYLLLSVRLAEAPSTRRWAAFGVLVGIAGLFRQVTLLPVPLICLWILWRHRRWRTVGGVALAAVVSLALIAPVTYRNWNAFDRLVLINTNAGYAFFWANHPIHGSSYLGLLPESGPSYQDLIPAELMGLDEAALNDALMERGWEFVRDDPVRYALLSISRIDDYFMFWPSSESATLSNIARVSSFGLFLPFMITGLWLSRHAWRSSMPLLIFASSYTLVHLISWAMIRYRLPVDAVLLVFAGASLDRTAVAIGRRLRADRA